MIVMEILEVGLVLCWSRRSSRNLKTSIVNLEYYQHLSGEPKTTSPCHGLILCPNLQRCPGPLHHLPSLAHLSHPASSTSTTGYYTLLHHLLLEPLHPQTVVYCSFVRVRQDLRLGYISSQYSDQTSWACFSLEKSSSAWALLAGSWCLSGWKSLANFL